MKIILYSLFILPATEVFSATCGSLPSQINNKLFYAEVISRSHLELELVVVGKQDRYRSSLMTIMGGKGYSQNNLPACERNQGINIEWKGSSIATHTTSDYDNFKAAYRVCIYSVSGELISDKAICNWETGD